MTLVRSAGSTPSIGDAADGAAHEQRLVADEADLERAGAYP